MSENKVKIIVTLGPSTRTEEDLRKIKESGVDFVRINMSHSSAEDLRYYIKLSKKVGIPFIIDTEGSQVRTGELKEARIYFEEGTRVMLTNKKIVGDKTKISIRPAEILSQLDVGDVIYCDLGSLILRVHDVQNASSGHISAQVITSGFLGNNKGAMVHSMIPNKGYDLPVLTQKDYKSIKLGLSEGVGFIAASFMRSGKSVDEVRRATKGKMKIISKIECIDALENLSEIIKKSDYLFIDRGDLSKEIAIERIPFTQKIIIGEAHREGKGVFVATNLLETMIENPKPTRAEIHDIEQTILDGAYGIVLAAETAVGKYPFECINTFNRVIEHVHKHVSQRHIPHGRKSGHTLTKPRYLDTKNMTDSLIEPHGGQLIDGLIERPSKKILSDMPSIAVSDEQYMDAEQIALGTFSPLEGFLGKADLKSVLDSMRLSNSVPWPVPIVLAVSKDDATPLSKGKDVLLTSRSGEPFGILSLKEKYSINKKEYAKKLYKTLDETHPGVREVLNMPPILLGGKVSVFRRRESSHKCYELTPRQARRLFEERGWRTVVGFHTRNVPHSGHEFIQLEALKKTYADGLFIHPVVGKKKTGDFQTTPIVKGYEIMTRDFYPKGKVIFGTFATFSRYAGPREAIFTALCRKNFGCSHFIVGRDHTGVGTFYKPNASHNIFNQFSDLGIKTVKFDKVFYSKKHKSHVHEKDAPHHNKKDKLNISGTEARKIFESGKTPPKWFMRPEISRIITNAYKNGEAVFVKEKKGDVIWLTGLSGSGKTTLAQKLYNELKARGKNVALLDGDEVRSIRGRRLGFSRKDIRENNLLIAEHAKKISAEYDIVLVAVISPYQKDREQTRHIIGDKYTEVFVNCPLNICEKRDTKGLYKKARAGEIDNFIGLSKKNPYESPLNPDIEINTDKISTKESARKIIKKLFPKIKPFV